VQQRVFDHDAVLVIEAVGEAITFFGQYDDSLRDRYHATLDVLNEQLSEDYAPRVAAKDCRTADEAAAHMQRLDHVSVLVLHGERLVNVCEHTGGHLRTKRLRQSRQMRFSL
jgi:hypothetical protein